MKLYFDSNIYDFISEKQQDDAVRRLIDERGHIVEASSGNLLEIYHNPEKSKCKQELQTLITVAALYEPRPQSWHQAQEVLSEIKRSRPYWFRQPVSQKLIQQEKEFLRGHKDEWERAKQLYIPPESVTFQYRKDSEDGIAHSRQVHKTLKQRLLENKLELTLAEQTKKGKINEILTDNLLDPDLFWRATNLLVWFEAIARRNPSSRDYADWLLPYIREDAFKTTVSYTDFWMNQVRTDKVPKNRIAALVDFYQMKHKITHGNAGDQMHACHMIDVDVFVTADKAFYNVLCEVKNHFTQCAKIIFLQRGATSALDELTNIFNSL